MSDDYRRINFFIDEITSKKMEWLKKNTDRPQEFKTNNTSNILRWLINAAFDSLAPNVIQETIEPQKATQLRLNINTSNVRILSKTFVDQDHLNFKNFARHIRGNR